MEKSAQLSQEEWGQVVARRLGTEDFEVLGTKERPLGAEGAGFLGEHRLAEVSVRAPAARGRIRSLHFFLKSAPRMAGQKELSEAAGTFLREVDVLSVLFPELRSSLNDAGRDMTWTCDCYHTRPDLIVLDDLAAQGFKTVGTRDPITFDHAALVLKALANLHSATLVYEESQPLKPFSLNAVYPDMLQECFFTSVPEVPHHPGVPYVEARVRIAQHLVEIIRGKAEGQKIENQLGSTIRSIYDLQKPSDKYRNVVCQGDLWRSNVLFRSENDKPVEVRVVDFQVIRYAPPANDVMSFLYLSTDRSFRKKFESRLLALYHARLSENLKRHGLLADDVLPWDEFEESCEFYRKLGLCLNACYKPIILQNREDMVKMLHTSHGFDNFLHGDLTHMTHAFNNDAVFREKITEIYEEILDFLVKE